uniref:ATG8-2 n=1 Tax=Dugesia japonica TaxID=6161 RepID=A0A1L7H9T6_DUGJA|nr:ATG8-2 [Dugesia japonica]
MKFKFQIEHSFNKRLEDSQKIKAKYPQRIPIIVEKHPSSRLVEIDKHKFLVPADITVAQFMWILRKRIDLSSDKALFLFVGKSVPQASMTMGQLYEDFRDEDGFLYAAYSGENSFGNFS